MNTYYTWAYSKYLHDIINRYLRLEIPEDLEIEGMSSTRRLARAKVCVPPDNKENIVALMSDTLDEEYPFFREGCQPDPIYTVTVGKLLTDFTIF